MNRPALWLALGGRVRPDPRHIASVIDLGVTADADPRWQAVLVPDSILALRFYDSTVVLAALAARTTRVRLGVGCMASLGLRQPVVVAQQWANLDLLSGGRMLFIACPGNRTGPRYDAELAAFDISYAEKVARMEEHIGFLRAVSSTDLVTYSGRTIEVAALDIEPKFIQRPLPIWYAGNPGRGAGASTVDRVLGRVAALADGWLTYNIGPDILAERIARLRELLSDQGRKEVPVAVQIMVTVGRDRSAALAEASEAWAGHSTRGISADDLPHIGAIGTPDECADRILRLHEAGATQVVVGLLSTSPLAQYELIAEHLLPRLVDDPGGVTSTARTLAVEGRGSAPGAPSSPPAPVADRVPAARS